MVDQPETKPPAARWDGRFGERFDDEVSTPGVAWTIIGTGLLTVVAMILMYGLFHWIVSGDRLYDERPLSLAAGEQPSPPLPRLQAEPEAEYRAFDAAMTRQLEGYGWVDEAAGIVHIPIEQAIELLAERGLPSAAASPASTDDAAADADPSASGAPATAEAPGS